jgi:tetratricopeptide (TPR) repeat protein
MKNYKKAIEDFDKAAQIEPTYAETYYLRGISKVELGKFGEGSYQDAIEDFLYSKDLNSRNPGIYKGIGESCRLMKDYERALYYLNEALKIDGKN